MATGIITAMLVLALLPVVNYWINVWLYRRPGAIASGRPAVSILIPARNEESGIAAAVEAALASGGVEIEVLVLDDHSEDRTAEIVSALAASDARVRMIQSISLPAGWSGKQFACLQLAAHARHDLLLFLDADVRLDPDGAARLVLFLVDSKSDLLSGVPHEETKTLLERLLIPLIHFVLLGYLPLGFARWFRGPAFAAGCGQLMLVRRSAYQTVGGHGAIAGSFHDGVMLPRAFRRAGFRTDICDATDLAVCRMYRSAREVWNGLAKNADEGLGSPGGIVPWTLILIGGQVLPFAFLGAAPLAAGFAIAAAYSMRFDAARRFRQSWLGAVLHPVGVLMLVAIQWYALARRLVGRPVGWKGRIPHNEIQLRDADSAPTSA